MRSLRLENMLTGTAVALVLAASTGAYAQQSGDALPQAGAVLAKNSLSNEAAASGSAGAALKSSIADQGDVTATLPDAPKRGIERLIREAAAGPAEPVSDEPVFRPAAAQEPVKLPKQEMAAPEEDANKDAPVDSVKPAVAPAEPAAQDAAKPASEPAKPVIAASLAEADLPVAEKLREMLSGKADRIFTRKSERAAVEAFYSERGYAPVWVEKGVANARAKAAIARLNAADDDGLDVADYPTPTFKEGDGAALAEAELKLMASVFTYARHAQIGSVHYSRVSADVSYNQVAPEAAEILAKISDGQNVADALDSYNPPHAGYKALKQKLAEVRGRKVDAGHARLADGPVLKIGMQDARVPQLRERLQVAGESDTYDKPLAEAVKKFQQQRQLSATGTLTVATVNAMNGPRAAGREADIIVANMLRWRWMPRDLGTAYVMVNIPDYTLKVMHDGAQAWTTKIVVGAPKTPTPIITETMKHITINPTWFVPPSIIYKEYLPAQAQDPTVLSRMGLVVTRNRDGSVAIRQPPGEKNALGRIKFSFPNKYLVYLHDTPQKHYFAHDRRAYSHGCMRVENPAKFAEVLFSISQPQQGFSAERIKRMFGSHEQQVNLTHQIPVHLTYQTAYVDDAGKLVIREDIYGRDARTIMALKSGSDRNADVAAASRSESSGSSSSVSTPRRRAVTRASAPVPSRFSAQPSGGGFFNFFSSQPVPPAPVGRRASFR
jgi:murein L,D-transpeptidase YcbB/YkuD